LLYLVVEVLLFWRSKQTPSVITSGGRKRKNALREDRPPKLTTGYKKKSSGVQKGA